MANPAAVRLAGRPGHGEIVYTSNGRAVRHVHSLPFPVENMEPPPCTIGNCAPPSPRIGHALPLPDATEAAVERAPSPIGRDATRAGDGARRA